MPLVVEVADLVAQRAPDRVLVLADLQALPTGQGQHHLKALQQPHRRETKCAHKNKHSHKHKHKCEARNKSSTKQEVSCNCKSSC